MSVSHAGTPSKGTSKATSRRVLGDLTPKALNTPSKRADPSDLDRAHSPLKQMQTLSPQLFGGKENAITSASKGKKRSIYDVDDPERVDDAKVRVAGSTAGKMGLSMAAVRLHTDATALFLSMPGSPTERNTPTPEPDHVFDLDNSQGTQASNNSFSALIDYDLCASQTNPPAAPLEDEKKSRAELLRTRLGFGIYKVKTNQVEKRSTDIISSWESSFSATADASSSMPITSSGESKDAYRVPNTNISPVRRDSQPVFVQANLDPFRPIGKLNLPEGPQQLGNMSLTPAPFLPPPEVFRRLHEYDFPSSPPQVISPAQLRSPIKERLNYATPANQSPGSEKADSDLRDGSAQSGIRKMQRFQEGELTSSAVKGNAAKGLMQLMAGKR